MPGTLTLAAGSAVAGWLLQHAYQHMRYSFYEREDAAMLADGADPAERRDWLAAIGAQIAIQAVSPSTIAALVASGYIDVTCFPPTSREPTRGATTPRSPAMPTGSRRTWPPRSPGPYTRRLPP